jgi:hypothetical protein
LDPFRGLGELRPMVVASVLVVVTLLVGQDIVEILNRKSR